MLVDIVIARPDLLSHKHRTLILQCNFCNVVYSRKYKLITAEANRHFCCKHCIYEAKKINPSVPRIRHLTCKICLQSFDVKRNTNDKDPKTCSRSCASSLKSRELNLVAYMQTKEVRARAMKTRSQHWADGTVLHPAIGHKWGPGKDSRKRLSERMSGERNPFFGKKHTNETCKKMREARSRLIVAGKMNWAIFGHKTGTFVSTKSGKHVHFRSSWEEAAMKWLDDNADVTIWDYECVRISYCFDKDKRWYIPDFLVTFIDGHQEMWEVKPAKFKENEKVRLKAEAAVKYCEKAHIQQYLILSRDDLVQRGVLLS